MERTINTSKSNTRTKLTRLLLQLSAVVALVSLSLQATSSVSYGQARQWSLPVRLSSGFGWFPDIVADLKGRVYVVWSSGDSTYDTVLYTTTADGKEWQPETDIAAMPSGGEVTRPTLLTDPLGQLHLSFRETAIYYTQAPAESAGSAATWIEPQLLSGSQVAYFSRLAMDSQGRLHIVYTENVLTPDCPICYHVFYRRSTDSGANWTQPVDIADLPTGAGKVQILVDKQDNLHVVWEAGLGGSYGQLAEPTKVMYAASYDGGDTWTPPVDMRALAQGATATSQRAKNIAIGLDGANQLVVAWLGMPEDQVYYQVSSNAGREWTAPKLIPNVWGAYSVYQGRTDDYAMATDSAGDIHLVLAGRIAQDQKSVSLLHLIWHNSTWAEPDIIVAPTGDVPEWPRIAVALGNQLQVVWFIRDEPHIFDSENGQYTVWYSHRVSSASAATPVPAWPTIPPRAATRIVQVPAASPTPIPAIAPGLPNASTDSLFTETDDLILIAKGLLPAIIVIVLVIVVVRVRTR
jgi:hypothetical protein